MAIVDCTRSGTGRGYINIDDVLDVYHGVTQEEQEDKKPEENTSEETIQEEPKEGQCDLTLCGSKCKTCFKSSQEDKKESTPKEFSWDDLSYESDDDEDDKYICEYCTKIGYSEKYDPDMCDDCDQCEQCNEYDIECSGCSYSCHRDGEYYRDKLDISEILPEKDMELLQRAKRSIIERDMTTRGIDDEFCILDI